MEPEQTGESTTPEQEQAADETHTAVTLAAPVMVNHALQINRAAIRYETFSGDNFMVAPFVGAVEGVMNGALILASELEHSAPLYPDSPVVVGHPMVNGEPISAKGQPVPKIGRVYNTAVKGDMLTGELWVSQRAAQSAPRGQEVLDNLATGKVNEVSWGWWMQAEPSSGEFKGKPYAVIGRNFIPDHLAILLDVPGACSVADGCGTLRANQALTVNCECGCSGHVVNPKPSITGEKTMQGNTQVDAPIEEDAVVDAVETSGAQTPAPTAPAQPDPAASLEVNQLQAVKAELAKLTDSFAQTTQLVANQNKLIEELLGERKTQKQQEREARIAELATYANQPFSAAELKSFSDEALTSLEGKFRPAYMAGMGMSINGRTTVADPNVGYAPAKPYLFGEVK
jgi:hypothetical protein